MKKSESAPGLEIWYTHRVSYGETDTMGVMYYAEYFHVFERARNEIIRASGHTYKELEQRGLFLPVAEAHCRYRSPARYDDLLQLHTVVTDWKHASFSFHYRMYDESRQRLLVEGFTKHACVNASGKPVAVPEWLKELLIPH